MSSDKLVKQSGRKAAKYRGAECLNCGHPLDLSDLYCAYCGQLNTTKQLSLKDFFGEFIGSVFTYDSRLRYTIKDLLFKPGRITYNYVKGQRLKYANPFRFFLSVSIIYFLIQSLISTISGKRQFIVNESDDRIETDSILNSNKIIMAPNGDPTLENLTIISDTLIIDKVTIPLNLNKDPREFEYISEEDLDTLSWTKRTMRRIILYRNFYEAHEIKDTNVALDSLKHRDNRLNRWVYEKNEAAERVIANPFGFLDYMMNKVPFFLFFFTPVFAFFFWLIYSKKNFTYIEHMVFIFHIFSFIFLALLILIIPDSFFEGTTLFAILFGLIGPFYFYKALRNFYKQGRLITILKFVFLSIVFFISATTAALLFFSISAAIY
ncbi:MAG: hypothetical protein ACI9M9_002501 [Flavobacteriaceae bacterium]